VGDPAYFTLRLWLDSNHNGFSEPGELFTLHSQGVERLYTGYEESERVDQHGNQFKFRGAADIRKRNGQLEKRRTFDVLFANQ